MADNLTIRRLIERVISGDVRIPAFQRDFVWDAEQVSFLMDSIYKNFPIGTVILWQTGTRLKSEKNLGSFQLPEPKKDYPVNYVLDGQQRITSIFSAFQTDLKPLDDGWTEVYFDLLAQENVQETLFFSLDDSEVDTNRHFPIHVLFDAVEYRKATEPFKEDQAILNKIDLLQARFKEYVVPHLTFESDDLNKVAIVFERINRAGTELNTFELISAWSWSEDFDLTEKFEELQSEIESHGYDDLCNDKDLQLKICSGVIAGKTTPGDLMGLKGQAVRENFQKIKNGIVGAIDFLKRELKVSHYKMLPYPALLVPLSVFFATEKIEGHPYSDLQKRKILSWFWRSVFTKRFASDVNERQAIDIVQMLKLKENENIEFDFPKREVRFGFDSSIFSSANSISKAFMLLLSNVGPHSFLSGAIIDTGKLLKKSSKHEFHHIFPKAYLEKQGFDKRAINCLANICFLTRSDNNKIKDSSPDLYVKDINETTKHSYLKEAFCPNSFGEMKFEDFIRARSELLSAQAMSLMEEF